MFRGEETLRVTTDVSVGDFDDKVREAFESIGDVEVSKGGSLSFFPRSSLSSFFSTVTIRGAIKKTDDGYKVSVDYNLAPSAALWVIAVLCMFFLLCIGGVIIIAPLIIDKPNVARCVENGMRNLKDEFGKSGRNLRSS